MTLTPPRENFAKNYRKMEQDFMKYKVFITALEFHLFSLLDKPQDIHAISKITETEPLLINKFLNILCSMGLLLKNNNQFENTIESSSFLSSQ